MANGIRKSLRVESHHTVSLLSQTPYGCAVAAELRSLGAPPGATCACGTKILRSLGVADLARPRAVAPEHPDGDIKQPQCRGVAPGRA